MYRKIGDFTKAWDSNCAGTGKVLRALTDASLGQAITDGHRTIGRIAWHMVQTLPEMANATGLTVTGPAPNDPVPGKAADIVKAYDDAAAAVREEISSKWDDAGLEIVDELYGQKWARGYTLQALIQHEAHHRGQLTVLMRQAGLKVPGVFGPSKEEWANYGAPPPEI